MNRLEFLKRLGIGTAAVAVSPIIKMLPAAPSPVVTYKYVAIATYFRISDELLEDLDREMFLIDLYKVPKDLV